MDASRSLNCILFRAILFRCTSISHLLTSALDVDACVMCTIMWTAMQNLFYHALYRNRNEGTYVVWNQSIDC